MVSWKKITKPKREGCLGIYAAKAKNIAFLAKLNWRLMTETSSLWAKVLNHNYRVDRRLTSAHLEDYLHLKGEVLPLAMLPQ